MWDNAPVLFVDVQKVWDAWVEMDFSRQYSANGNPLGIPCTEIESWLSLNLILDEAWRYELYKLIRTLDLAWLKFRPKKSKNAKKPRGNTSSSN